MNTNEIQEFSGKFIKTLWKSADELAFLANFSITNTNQVIAVFVDNISLDFYTNYKLKVIKQNRSYKCVDYQLIPFDSDQLIDFLSSPFFPKITKIQAKKIVQFFPKDTINAILKTPEELLNVFKWKANKHEQFVEKLMNYHNLLRFQKYQLIRFYLNLETLIKKWQKSNDHQNIEQLTINPYYLIYLEEFSFDEIDTYALKILNWKEDNINRKKALIINSILEMEQKNHTKFRSMDIFNQTLKNYFFNNKDFTNTLEILISEKIIIKLDDGFLTNSSMYEKELFIWDYLVKISKRPIDNFIADKIKFNQMGEEQLASIENIVNHPVSLLTGYPGTGKTKTLIEILNVITINFYKKNQIVILTPTAKAALPIKLKTNYEANTVHSFFKIKPGKLKTNFDALAFKNIKVLVIDEFSMISIDLFWIILKNLHNLEKIILVGDHNQLPTIGPGNLLEDLMQSKLFCVKKLTKNYRAENKADLINVYLKVNQNKLFTLNSENVQFVQASEENYWKKLQEIYFGDLSEYEVFEKEILIPTYKTNVGITKTNLEIQKLLQQNQWNSEQKYYKNDKVIQKINNYEKNVVNGEVGMIKNIECNEQNKRVISANIDFSNNEIQYQKGQINENIDLAYATTIHKFQGNEAKAVIFVVFNNLQFKYMLKSKQLIYTAISRATEKLVIIGDEDFFKHIILNAKSPKIKTNILDMVLKNN